MSRRETYESETEKLLTPIAERFGVRIYDIEYVKEDSDWYLRAYIDKTGGVTIMDCENVSRALSDELDKKDFIEDAYILEVSSPGLGRALKKDRHLAGSLGEEVVSFQDWQAFYSQQPWIEERIEKLQSDLSVIRKMRPFAAVNYIRKAVGYDDFLKEYADYRKIEKEGLFEVLDSLQESSKPYADFSDWFTHIARYKEELEDAYAKQTKEQEAVTLATFHSAKGLEFQVVHILDVNEGITPYKKAVLPADLEE